MKDIDFDELDRAVNSLMGGVPKAEPAKEDDVKTLSLTLSDSSPSTSTPAETTPSEPPRNAPSETPGVQEQPKPEGQAEPLKTVAPAARRGRFMDMVRPQAAEPRKPVSARPVSRQGSTIQPSAGFSQPASPSVDGITPPVQQVSNEQDLSSASDWPDPLSAVDFNATTKVVAAKAERTESRTAVAGTATQDASAPLASPFLPDAKVEKRPLGRLSSPEEASEPVMEPGHAPVLGALATSDAEEKGKPESNGDAAVPPPQPLPVELGQEVMAIEADTSNLQDDTAEAVKPEAVPAPARPAAAPVAPASSRPVATSIPQQYKVQPANTPSESSTGAIYDVAAYHQPLSHPAKKKPGWLWVVAIVLILLLGAASGAAVYFFGLI